MMAMKIVKGCSVVVSLGLIGCSVPKYYDVKNDPKFDDYRCLQTKKESYIYTPPEHSRTIYPDPYLYVSDLFIGFAKKDIEYKCLGYRYMLVPKGTRVIIEDIKQHWNLENGTRLWINGELHVNPKIKILIYDTSADNYIEFFDRNFDQCADGESNNRLLPIKSNC